MSLGLESNQYERKRRALQLVLGICIAVAILISGLLVIFLRPAHAAELSPDDFVLTYTTDAGWGNSGRSFLTVQTNDTYAYDYDIDWNNDGVFDEIGATGDVDHDYGTPGTYTVRIRGEFPAYQCAYYAYADCDNIVAINQWGSGVWKTMAMAFFGTSSLRAMPTDIPNLSEVTDMSRMFQDSSLNDGNFSNWDTSHVTNMNRVFSEATTFAGDVSSWDTSSVTDMSGAFQNTYLFASDLSSWDMSQVVAADDMFYNSGISVEHYEAALDGWSRQNLQPGVTLGVYGVEYCSSTSRQVIIDAFSWAIDGDRITPACTIAFDGRDTSATLQEDLPIGTPVGTLKADKFALHSAQPYVIGCTVPGADDSFFTIGGPNRDQLLSGEVFEYAQPSSPQFARVASSSGGNNTYDVCVVARTIDGEIVENHLSIRVVMGPRVKNVTSSAFSHEDGKTLLTIGGEWLVGSQSPYEINGAYYQSLVRLNGVDLAFCSGAGGMNAAETIEEYKDYSPSIAQLVTDTPPCYRLYDADWNDLITLTQAVIVLPADFDTSARGAVSVNGSNTYTFNAPVDEVTPVQPDANVNGTKPLPQHPTIPVRPTFSGVAESGAQIRVTVHSDPVTCTTTADATGNWSCTLATDLPAGEHTVYVQVTNPDNSVINLGPYAVTVDGSVPGAVTSTSPLAPGVPNTGLLEIMNAHKARQAAERSSVVWIIAGVAAASLVLVLYGSYRYRTRKSVMFNR